MPKKPQHEENQKPLAALVAKINITRYLHYKDYFKAIYEFMNEKFGKYTHEQFAGDLNIPKTNFTIELVNGTAHLTVAMAEKIVTAMNLPKLQGQYLIKLVEFLHSHDSQKREEAFYKMLAIKQRIGPAPLNSAWLQLFTAWQHLALFEMIDIEDFEPDPAWIRRHLLIDLRPLQITKSLELLQELGLVRIIDGKPVKDQQTLDTGPEIKGLEANTYHLQMLDLAKEALAITSGDQRDFSSITVAVDDLGHQKIKHILQEAGEAILKVSADCKTKTRVSQINMQLFPLTKRLKQVRGNQKK